MCKMHEDFFSRYEYMYSSCGFCAIFMVICKIYCEQLIFILSRLRSHHNEEMINSTMQHWQPLLVVLVTVEMTNFHFGLSRLVKTYTDICMLFFEFFLHQFIPLLITYVLIKSIRQNDSEEECYFVQGLFFLQVFYPTNSCPWSTTIYESTLLLGALVISVFHAIHKFLGMSFKKMAIIAFSSAEVINLVISLWRVTFSQDPYLQPRRHLFFSFLFAYFQAIMWVEFHDEIERRPKPFKWWHKPSKLSTLILKLLYDFLYWSTFFFLLFLIGVESTILKFISNEFLLIIIDISMTPMLITGTEILMNLLVYGKTFASERLYHGRFLQELGKRSQCVMLGHILSSYIVEETAISVQLGPNNIATLLLYISGELAFVFFFSYLCDLITRQIMAFFDKALFSKYGPGFECR